MEIQICPNCNKEFSEKVRFTVQGCWIWTIDHYETGEAEAFFYCDNCGEYLNPADFGYGA